LSISESNKNSAATGVKETPTTSQALCPQLSNISLNGKTTSSGKDVSVTTSVAVKSSSEINTSCLKNGLTDSSQPHSTSDHVAGTRKPTVKWYQRNSDVYIRVCVPDIKKYSLVLGSDKRTLSFASEDPPNYFFQIALYGKVHTPPEETLLGQHLLIKMKKLSEDFKWKDIARVGMRGMRSWLTKDLNDVDSDDSDEEEGDNYDDTGRQSLRHEWGLANSEPAHYESDDDDLSTSSEESDIEDQVAN